MLQKLNKYTNLSSTIVVGQTSIKYQENELRKNPDVVMATPGRLIDILTNSQGVDLDDVEFLIFDEADKLLEMGFKHEVEEILRLLSNSNRTRQTLLFSATLDSDVKKLVKLALKKPLRIQANTDNRVSQYLRQEVVLLKEDRRREAALVYILTEVFTESAIVFFRTKKQCHRFSILLTLLGKKSGELHGNLTQQQRFTSFEDFKNKKLDVLLATDLAARGLDIPGLKYVINFELPKKVTRYIHRVGRTARAGKSGVSLTLANQVEFEKIKKLVKKTKDKLFKRNFESDRLEEMEEKIDVLEGDVERILDEEKVERQVRLAKMELEKAQNLIKYKEEIFTRPKKNWFRSYRSRNEANEEAKEKALLEDF